MFGKKATGVVAAVVARAKGWFGADGDARPVRASVGERFATMIERSRAASPMVKGGAMDDSTGANTIKAAYAATLGDLPEALVGWFLSQGFIGHQLCAYLAQHWLIAKALAMPARDAVRNGYTVVSDSGDDLAPEVTHAMKKADEKFRINAHMRDFITKGRTFGIRIAIFKVKSTDPAYYEKPFNPDGITEGAYEGIVQVDPYWCAPEFDSASAIDPASLHFYEPTWWIINGKKYHRTHLVIFRNGDVADLLKSQYGYGGIPVPQLIMERVYGSERTANEAPQLVMTKRTTVFGTDVAAALADQDKFNERLADWARYRDNYAVKLLDKEGDEMQQFDTALSDLDAVIMTQYQLVAAAAGVPATKLLGTTPKGFNSTGEYEEASYHEELESVQANDLQPLIERHHLFVMRSLIAPRVLKGEPISTSVVWSPLDSPTAKEQAETNNAKANADKALVEAGAIDATDVRKRLREDKDSGYYGIVEAVPEEPMLPEEPITEAAPGAVAADAMDGVRLVSNQTFIDEAIIAEKIVQRDFTVQVSPVFRDPETLALYRIVIDGHHSLEAAKRCRIVPTLIEGEYGASDYTVVAEVG